MQWCVASAYFLIGPPAYSLEFKEGDDYELIHNAGAAGKNKVIEFFAYSCPYCFRSQAAVEKMVSKLPSNYEYERVAVTLGKPERMSYAYTHLLLKEFALEQSWHSYIFFLSQQPLPDELKAYDKLWTMKNVHDFFVGSGISEDRYSAAIKAIDENQLIKNNDKLAGSFQVKVTPTFVINGQYRVEGLPGGPDGQKRLEDLLLYLVARSKQSNN